MGRKEAEHGPSLMDDTRDSLSRSAKEKSGHICIQSALLLLSTKICILSQTHKV